MLDHSLSIDFSNIDVSRVDKQTADAQDRVSEIYEALQRLGPLESLRLIDLGLAPRRRHLADLETTQQGPIAQLSALVASLDGRVETADQRSARLELETSIEQLNRGIRPTDGVTPAVTRFIGRPGIEQTKAEIHLLEQWRAAAQHEATIDPSATALYRYVGQNGGHYGPDGRPLKPGETVVLTRAQFKAFADRFEIVTSDAA